MASRVAALLLLGVVCFWFAAAEVPMNCCLRTSSSRVLAKNIVGYAIQEAGKGCDISATVFITKRGIQLCVIPRNQQPWVQNIINILDRKNQGQ